MYKLYIRKPQTEVDAAMKINEDGSVTSFVFDDNNPDYQAFLAWCDAGNTPLPADGE